MVELDELDEHERVAIFVQHVTEAAITRPDKRDIQALPGPSDLSNPCDLCVAAVIAKACGVHMPTGPKNFSLKAWNGTAIHEKLERDVPKIYPHGSHELTVEIATIDGLGVIEGHIDVYFPRKAAVNDYKGTDLEKLAVYRTHEVPRAHVGQIMLYTYGVIKSDRPAETAVLTYIPRDSNKVSDIWTKSFPYQEGIAIGLLNRAKNLVEVVHSGKTDTLQSDPGCYVCNTQRYRSGY